jgi:hypothetical protein
MAMDFRAVALDLRAEAHDLRAAARDLLSYGVKLDIDLHLTRGRTAPTSGAPNQRVDGALLF